MQAGGSSGQRIKSQKMSCWMCLCVCLYVCMHACTRSRDECTHASDSNQRAQVMRHGNAAPICYTFGPQVHHCICVLEYLWTCNRPAMPLPEGLRLPLHTHLYCDIRPVDSNATSN